MDLKSEAREAAERIMVDQMRAQVLAKAVAVAALSVFLPALGAKATATATVSRIAIMAATR